MPSQQLTISDKEGGLITLKIWQTERLSPGEALWVWDKNVLLLGHDAYHYWDDLSGDNVGQKKFLDKCRRVIFHGLPPSIRQLLGQNNVPMNKFKGTPGPWQTYSEAVDRESFVNNCRVVSVIDGFEGYVGIADTNESGYVGQSGEVKQANAKLIAAAPELLDSLNQAIKWCQQHKVESAWLDDAKKAVNKAIEVKEQPSIVWKQKYEPSARRPPKTKHP